MNDLRRLCWILLLVVAAWKPARVIGFAPQESNGRSQFSSVLWLASDSSISPDYSNQAPPPPPPPPGFVAKPLPVLLGGGLFLFATSVPSQHEQFAQELLQVIQLVLRNDATIGMEFGQGVETGGIYASKFATSGSYDQLVLQFQIEGGNAWAQGVAYGVRLSSPSSSPSSSSDKDSISANNDNETDGNTIRLVSLEVANMDASINGTPLEINIPPPLQ